MTVIKSYNVYKGFGKARIIDMCEVYMMTPFSSTCLGPCELVSTRPLTVRMIYDLTESL